MCKFIIRYASGMEKVYEVVFNPHPTNRMLYSLAKEMLNEKGGRAVEYSGPNGLYGFITRKSQQGQSI